MPKKISVAVTREFIDHRRLLEKLLTQGAFDREMDLALAGKKFGLSAGAIIRECIDAEWWSIKVEWAHARMTKANTHSLVMVNSKKQSLVGQLSDRS